MKNTFFTVGPSEVYPGVEKYLRQAISEQIPSLSHRGKQFQQMYENTESLLKKLLSIPDDYRVFFLGSSVEAMERIIENTVEKTSFHFVDGAFSQKAAGIAEELKKNVIKTVSPESSDFDITGIVIPDDAELIFITENDTSTGLIFPHEYIYHLKKRYPSMLVAVDLVSSAPYSDIDFSKIDLAFFSGQKGFGIPAGLSILVVSPAAIKKSQVLQKKNINIGSYHNFPTLLKNRDNYMTPETPNVLAIYLLEKVVADMVKKGIGELRKEIDEKARLLYEFFEKKKGFEISVKDERFRSPSTLVISVDTPSKLIIDSLVKKGILIGSGYGSNKDTQIRIANFPAHTKTQVMKLIKSLQLSS